MAFLVCSEFWWLKWSAESWFMRHSPLNAGIGVCFSVNNKEQRRYLMQFKSIL
ncbi:hypothetical protein [Vibrio vulnificus YJ016]|uniref:Uncharacterized protein n=1 Tax=Vibrio vulnificus (strain YJ016) TaxID=196600 RepID=Q7MKK5_VIBVY|nr:hypothetical protein [Vibrio vulnificus YJ016]